MINWTDMPLRVGLKGPLGRDFSFLETVAPGEQLQLPSVRAESSMIRLRPAGEAVRGSAVLQAYNQQCEPGVLCRR